MPHRNIKAAVDSPLPRSNQPTMLQQPQETSLNLKSGRETPLPKDAEVEILHSGKWLSFGHINFTDPIHKKQRQWEFVRRNRHTSSTVDGKILDGINGVF